MGLNRRTFLGATALSVGFAGCLGGSGGSDSGTTTAATGDSAPTEPSTTTEEAITTATNESAGMTEPTGTTGTKGTAGTPGPTVQVASHPGLGDILVGPEGMTLYMFDQDSEGESASACSGDCVEAWPPLTTTGEPSAGDGVTAQIATFERETGETQVMAGGWPLYYFASDEQAGDTKGQGVNDIWWVLSPDGTPIRAAATTTDQSNTSTEGGGGGGPYQLYQNS